MIEYYLAGWGPLFAPEISPLARMKKAPEGRSHYRFARPDHQAAMGRAFFFVTSSSARSQSSSS